MRRRVFTVLSFVSLLLCAAVCVLWVRSYRVTDVVIVPVSSTAAPRRAETPFGYAEEFAVQVHTRAAVAIAPGAMHIRWTWFTSVLGENRPAKWTVRPASPDDWPDVIERSTTRWRLVGFTWARREGPRGHASLRVPLWAIAGPTAALSVVWLRRHRTRRRAQARRTAGRCPACGYDLRATPGRCPECGAVPPAAAGGASR